MKKDFMDKELYILIVEDSATDAELITRELVKENLVNTSKLVKSKDEFIKALEKNRPDIILCDYKMPVFSAPEALEILEKSYPEIPFIVVSGTIGEATAVDMMKLGAADYVMKDKIFRLVPAVKRSLKENEERVERKKAEEALKESELKFKTIFETSRDGMLMVEVKTKKFSMCNKAMRDMLGYAEGEVERLSINDIHPDADLPRAIRGFERLVQEEIKIVENIPIKRKDGSIFYADIVGSHLILYGKNYLIGTFRDITDRKRLEDILLKNNSLLTSTLESTFGGILVIDRKDKVVSYNKKFMEMWNIPESILESGEDEQLLGFVLYQLKYPDEFLKKIKEIYANPNRVSHDSVEFKDGRIFDRYSQPQKIGDKVIGTVWSFADITERKRVEKVLEQSEKHFRLLVENAPEAIYIQTDKHFVYVNGAAMDLFGAKSQDQLIGYPIMERFHPDFRVAIEERINLINEKQLAVPILEEKYLRLDGSPVDVEVSAVPYNYKGQDGALVFVRDITIRKQLTRQQNDFMNTVSHELRTPLSSIKESISLVLEGVIGTVNEQQQKVLYAGKRNVDRLTRLVNQVLDFQKIASGQMKYHFEKNDINSVIKEAHMSMISLATKKGLRIDLNLHDDLPRIDFDKDKIIEVLVNIINNAIKYTERGSITITSSRQGNTIQISIKDTGPGIKEEDIPKLFQRFSQLGRKPGGSGLGLAISKETINAHKGKIWVESEFGKGSTFHFILPIEERRR